MVIYLFLSEKEKNTLMVWKQNEFEKVHVLMRKKFMNKPICEFSTKLSVYARNDFAW